MIKQRACILVAAALLALVATSCTSTTKPSGLVVSNDNNCGAAYLLTSPATDVGTACGGVIGYPPVNVALKPGEHFQVNAVSNLGATHYPHLRLHGNAVEPVSRKGSSTVYVAVRAGSASLLAEPRYCEKSRSGGCAAFRIVVS